MSYVIHGKNVDKVTKKTICWTMPLKPLAEGTSKFRGRPHLTRRILPAFQDLCRDVAQSSAERHRHYLQHFWQFLDEQEKRASLFQDTRQLKIDDLEWLQLEALWRHFISWLRDMPESKFNHRSKYNTNQAVYAIFRRAFDLAVEFNQTDMETLDIYVYFRFKRSTAYGEDVLSFEDAKNAFRALVRTWRKICSRTTAARKIAAEGKNPMTGSSGANRWGGGAWSSPANCLWVVERLLPFAGLLPDKILYRRAHDGMRHPVPTHLLIPEVDKRSTGMHAYATTRFLGLPELSIAFAMVSMKTGFNSDTISRMTVDDWSRPDPLNPGKRAILYGPKRVGNRIQRVSSSIVRKTDAYQIIKFVIDIQAPIRERLKELAKETNDPELERRGSLIWIGVLNGALIDLLPRHAAFYEPYQYLDEFFDKAGVLRENGTPLRYRMTQGRDIWASFVYHRSGMNYLLTAQALGHSTLGTLLHYLEKKQEIVKDRKRLIELQNKVFKDLQQGQYGPRRYREGHTETAVTGLNCVDFLNPAPEADPGHRAGASCVAQRCFQCWNWFATKESLPYLVRIIHDLEELRETLSIALWETSDYPLELALYKHIVSKFAEEHIVAATKVAHHLAPIVQTSLFVGSRLARLPSP